jgi:uncharacterized protein YcfJ
MNEGKKMLILLGGVSGIAVIIVLTVFALQLILQRNAMSPAPVVEKPVVQISPAPVVEKLVPQTAPAAQVTSVKPHYISGTIPKRECRKVQRIVYVSQGSSANGAGAVIGGVTGGLLGSQVGGGNGRIVTSAAGAAIGALTGNSVQNSMNAPQPRVVYSTICYTHRVKTTIQKGYEVAYSYNGQPGVIIMNDSPLVGSVLPFPIK